MEKQFNISIKRETKKASAYKRWSIHRDMCIKAVESEQAYQDFVRSVEGCNAYFKVLFSHAHDTFKMDEDLSAAHDLLSDGIFDASWLFEDLDIDELKGGDVLCEAQCLI